MLKLFPLFVLCACSISVKQTARIDKSTFHQVYTLAEQSFSKHLPCSLPTNVELTIKDASLIDLNRGHNIFGSDGLYIRQGLYDPQTKTISIAKERPDKRFVLFHELEHFFITESSNCFAYTDVKIQHKYLAVMEEDYLVDFGRTREQEEEHRWIIDYLRRLIKEIP